MDKSSYIYMMGNASRRSLYAGVCASLEERVWEHKNGLGGAFTKDISVIAWYILRSSQISNLPLHARKKSRAGDVLTKDSSSIPSTPIGTTWPPTGIRIELLLDGKPIK